MERRSETISRRFKRGIVCSLRGINTAGSLWFPLAAPPPVWLCYRTDIFMVLHHRGELSAACVPSGGERGVLSGVAGGPSIIFGTGPSPCISP